MEIGTAWISLAVSGKGLKSSIEREANGAGAAAGKKIGTELSSEVDRGAKNAAKKIEQTFGERLGERAGTAVGKAIGVGVGRFGGESGQKWLREFQQKVSNATVKGPRVNTPINVDAAKVLGAGRAGRESAGASASEAGLLAGLGRIGPKTVIAATGAALLYKTLSAGFDRAKSLDATRFKLQALGNDATTVAQIMNAAQASVKGTAFSMDEAATTAATAVAAGVKPGADLSKYLNTVADAAAIAGADLSDMGHIFNKVQTSGKAMTDDLNMLGDRGLPIFTWLQKEYKVTGAELSKMVEQGKVDAATFQKVIAENVGGAAKKMGGTFEGSMKNMGAALGRLGEAIIGPFLGNGTDALGKLTETLDSFTGFLKEHQPEIIRFAGDVGAAFSALGSAVAGGTADALRAVAKFWDGLKTTSAGIGGFFSAIGATGVGDALQQWGNDRSANDKIRELAGDLDKGKDALDRYSDASHRWGEVTANAARVTQDLQEKIALLPDGKTIVLTDNSPEVIAKIDKTKYAIEHLPNGQVKVTAQTAEAEQQMDDFRIKQAGQPLKITINPSIDRTLGGGFADKLYADGHQSKVRPSEELPSGMGGNANGNPLLFGVLPKRMFGAIAMAAGGFRVIDKPQSAGLYAGRGAGTIFAEEQTGGEAYIPLAPGKRPRSMAILREVARLFGVNSFEAGGISVDELKSMVSGIEGQSYGWGAPAGPGSDCSGAQSWVSNMITGATGRFATQGESSALAARGFTAGDPPPGIAAYWIGWKNGGPGGDHTAGTIVDPDGGNVNVEMGGKRGNGQFGGGASGASDFPNRAWIALAAGDNGRTTGGGGGASASQVMSAQSSVRRAKASSAAAQKDLDDANAELKAAPDDKKRKAAEKKRDNAQRRLDSAKDRQAVAEQKLSEVLSKKAKGTDREANSAKDFGGQGLGQSIISGMFQGLGIDGSVFSNPLEWPNMKSGMAALNWGLNYANAWAKADGEIPGGAPELNLGGDVANGMLGGVGINTQMANQPATAPTAPQRGGDTYNISGVNPAEVVPKLQAPQYAAARRQGFA